MPNALLRCCLAGLATVLALAAQAAPSAPQRHAAQLLLLDAAPPEPTPDPIAPTVTLTAPADGTVTTAPADVTLAADAADADGHIARVEFYRDGQLLGSSAASPYRYTWSGIAAGSYRLSARAYDNSGLSADSAPVTLAVQPPNQPPQVRIASPVSGAIAPAPANFALTADASDADGQVTRVEYWSGNRLLGSQTGTPYRQEWRDLAAGSYVVTARAFDDKGASSDSVPVTLDVSAPGTTATRITYLYPDHLGTPRLATDEQGKPVWRLDPLGEPFGDATPDEDPDHDGVLFELNLRFPGQYYDRETGLSQNTFRDYDPASGRYVQSDPIGLAGGQWSPYAYVGNNPSTQIDPFGLLGQGSPGQYQASMDACRVNPDQCQGTALERLRNTLHEMESKDVRGTDQFFHCLAACRAKKAGNSVDTIRFLMDRKEDRDYVLNKFGLYGDGKLTDDKMLEDMARDKQANEQGMQCPSNLSCNEQCRPLLNDVPARRLKFMQEYLQ